MNWIVFKFFKLFQLSKFFNLNIKINKNIWISFSNQFVTNNLCTKCRFSWALQFVKNSINFDSLEEDQKKAANWKKCIEVQARHLKETQAYDCYRFMTAETPEDVDSDDSEVFEFVGVNGSGLVKNLSLVWTCYL